MRKLKQCACRHSYICYRYILTQLTLYCKCTVQLFSCNCNCICILVHTYSIIECIFHSQLLYCTVHCTAFFVKHFTKFKILRIQSMVRSFCVIFYKMYLYGYVYSSWTTLFVSYFIKCICTGTCTVHGQLFLCHIL